MYSSAVFLSIEVISHGRAYRLNWIINCRTLRILYACYRHISFHEVCVIHTVVGWCAQNLICLLPKYMYLSLTLSAMGVPRRLSGKEPAWQCRRLGFDPWVRKIPWKRKWQPTPVLLPGKSHGRRNLAGYTPWGHKRVGHNLATKTTRATSGIWVDEGIISHSSHLWKPENQGPEPATQ